MNENIKKEVIGKSRVFKLIYNLPSKTKFSVDGLEESEIEKILEIESVSAVIYDIKTRQLEINHNNTFPFMTLLEGIKLKIPKAVFHKNSDGEIQNDITHTSTIIQNLTKKGDDAVKNMFKGHADSQDLLFLFTLTMAAEELIRNPVMPKWYDWFKIAQSVHSDIQTKTELGTVEEEIKVTEQVNVDDFKKLVTSIDELKSLIEKKFTEKGTK